MTDQSRSGVSYRSKTYDEWVVIDRSTGTQQTVAKGDVAATARSLASYLRRDGPRDVDLYERRTRTTVESRELGNPP